MTLNYIEAIRALEEGSLKPLIFVFGDEPYLRDFFVKIIKDEYATPGMEEFNYDKLENPSFAEVKGAGETLPLGTERRVVEIRGLDLSRNAIGKIRGLLDDLEAYADELSDHVYMLVVSSSGKFLKGAFYKAMAEKASLVETNKLTGRNLQSFVSKQLDSKGQRLGKALIDHIIMRSGYESEELGKDLYDLSSSLDKISGLTGPVSIEDIDSLMAEDVVGNIFSLTDAMGRRDVAGSIRSLNDILEKEDGYMTFYMIARLYRNLINVKLSLAKNMSRGQMSKELGISSFELGKLVDFQRNYSLKELADLFELIYQADFNLKSSKGSLVQNLYYIIGNI